MKVQDRTPERLGPYHVVSRLGQGGMGVVYLATDATGQSVAVKALHPGMAQEENARRRLAREVETMHRVRSPFVAQVLGADLDGDPPYIVTRYVPGLTLDAVVASGGAVTGAPLARLAYGLAQALAAVHAAGVVHRDLKPGNVMISNGEPVVIDFGIAQLAETTRLTTTGMFMGTPGYLAPEVVEGKDSGPASDVHSWGATVAFAATGRPPFGTGSFETIFFRIVHGEPDLAMLPLPLRPMVLRALARDPAVRPSAAELAQWAASLDPAALVPATPGHIPSQAGPDGAPHTVADQPGWRDLSASTRPLNPLNDDVRDLLPPVEYGPSAGIRPVASSGGQPPARQRQIEAADLAEQSQFGSADSGPGRSPGRGTGVIAGVSPWSPLVIASVVVAVAASVIAPLAGTAIGLALFALLRAAATSGRQLSRRAAAGKLTGASFAAIVLFPLSLLRALIGLVLLAPVALLGCCVTAAATIIAVPVHPLPQALALGAGTMVAIVGLGPGSSGSRSIIASMYTSVARTPARLAVAYLGILGVCAWAGITAWYRSPAAAYWPVVGLHAQLEHMPTLHRVLTDARHSLLSLARQFGL